MCISKLDEVQRKRGGVGYKILHRDANGHLMHSICQGSDWRQLKVGEWIEDKKSASVMIPAEVSGVYPTGYHIFTSPNDLEVFKQVHGWCSGVTCKVRFKNVVASGCQTNYRYPDETMRVVVTRSVKLLEVIDKRFTVQTDKDGYVVVKIRR